jgi:hypothetical protein
MPTYNTVFLITYGAPISFLYTQKGKDPLIKDNFRGITITPILSKALEQVVLARIKNNLYQSHLQFGFTKGLSPTLAILVVTEAIADSLDSKTPLYLLALDVRKAFDVVRHGSLCRKLYDQLDAYSWKFIRRNLLTLAQVKLSNLLGENFCVEQGVGQGKIMSTHCYKAYINDLLDRLDGAAQGFEIGNTYMGAPTCADDIIIIANNFIDL